MQKFKLDLKKPSLLVKETDVSFENKLTFFTSLFEKSGVSIWWKTWLHKERWRCLS